MHLLNEAWFYIIAGIGIMAVGALAYGLIGDQQVRAEQQRQSSQRLKTKASGEPMATVTPPEHDGWADFPLAEADGRPAPVPTSNVRIFPKHPDREWDLPPRPTTRPPSIFHGTDHPNLPASEAPLTLALSRSLNDDEAQVMADGLANLFEGEE